MEFHSRKILLLFLSVFFAISSIAQDVRSVDPKTMPESDVKRVEEAIRNAGLSPTEAANMARQRGASEQQIRDMQQRLMQQSSSGDELTSEGEEDTTDSEAGSETEKLTQRQAPQESSSPIFGSYLFNSTNLTFEPSLNIQTQKNYEIGIGDQIIINIWGNSQNNYQLTVNTNGQIMIPDVGPVYVAGMTFENAETKIKQRLTEIYADMGSDNPQTFAQVNMGQLRSIKVNLVGEVTAPGTYTLPVTATAFNALYLSGGPNNIGSFRKINIIRDENVFKTIDIYKFLIDADISENIRLKDEDIIFIPPAEKKVTISGEFKRNGIFEMKEGENRSELIRFARWRTFVMCACPVYPVGIFQSTGMKFEEYFTGTLLEQKKNKKTGSRLSWSNGSIHPMTPSHRMNNSKPPASLPATPTGFTAHPTIFWISPLGAGVKNPENRKQKALEKRIVS